MTAIYDVIGRGYSSQRQPDPRIYQAILEALGDAQSIVNVGAGTGSYEPRDRSVVAVEPSQIMIDQRDENSAPVIQATASALPFEDNSFDAALAILTIHHWDDQRLGLSELRRVARKRTVIFTWDPSFDNFWLTDYFPEILEIDKRIFPKVAEFYGEFGEVKVHRVEIPTDCTDGFLCAYWSRPHAYLDPAVRAGISTFSLISDVDIGLKKLESDLSNGVWESRYGKSKDLPALDLGYVLVTINC